MGYGPSGAEVTVVSVAGVTVTRVESAVVESDEPMGYHVDGEPCAGGTRLEARIHPGVLRIAAG